MIFPCGSYHAKIMEECSNQDAFYQALIDSGIKCAYFSEQGFAKIPNPHMVGVIVGWYFIIPKKRLRIFIQDFQVASLGPVDPYLK